MLSSCASPKPAPPLVPRYAGQLQDKMKELEDEAAERGIADLAGALADVVAQEQQCRTALSPQV